MSRMFINGVSILFLISFAVMAQSQPEKFVIGAYAQSVPEQSYITNPPLLENAKINHLLFIGTKVGADPQGLYLENGDTAL
ncbi:MAG: hypothetical protein HUU54_17545, partial [Ignavibacteriaceae bacterium]|nr:hypothetical protein [Ignavibacteriaceae bacterium]